MAIERLFVHALGPLAKREKSKNMAQWDAEEGQRRHLQTETSESMCRETRSASQCLVNAGPRVCGQVWCGLGLRGELATHPITGQIDRVSYRRDPAAPITPP